MKVLIKEVENLERNFGTESTNTEMINSKEVQRKILVGRRTQSSELKETTVQWKLLHFEEQKEKKMEEKVTVLVSPEEKELENIRSNVFVRQTDIVLVC